MAVGNLSDDLPAKVPDETGTPILHGTLQILGARPRGQHPSDRQQPHRDPHPKSCLGRKNYLFAGSHNGATRPPMVYSYCVTCTFNAVVPDKGFHDVQRPLPDHHLIKPEDRSTPTTKLARPRCGYTGGCNNLAHSHS